jgi:DNA modification methylase
MDVFSNAGDLVLDVMVGSGTVLKVAKDLKRRAIGIDISPKAVEIAKGRLMM